MRMHACTVMHTHTFMHTHTHTSLPYITIACVFIPIQGVSIVAAACVAPVSVVTVLVTKVSPLSTFHSIYRNRVENQVPTYGAGGKVVGKKIESHMPTLCCTVSNIIICSVVGCGLK